MTTDIIPFQFEQDQIRVVNRDESPWWVAVDITKALGYPNARQALTSHVDDEDRDTVQILDSMGRERIVNVISESGLFALMMGSKKPQARTFKRWVTSEVLPEIRRWGFYDPSLSESEKELRWAQQLVKAVEAKVKAEKELEAAKPKAIRYDLLQEVDGGYSLHTAGRAFGFGGPSGLGSVYVFNQFLIDIGLCTRNASGRIIATDEALGKKWLIVRGVRTPVITEAGLKYLESLGLAETV